MRLNAVLVMFVFLFTVSYSQKKAPNFVLEDINGNKVELKTLAGKGPVLISFWATWCKPCIEEMAEYNKIYSDLKNKGLTILAVSIDDSKTQTRVKPWVKSKGYGFDFLLDKNSETANKFKVDNRVPFNVLLDKKLNVAFTHEGYVKGDETQMRKKIEELLK